MGGGWHPGGEGGLAQWGKWVINSFFCIFMYFLNKTLCWAKGLGLIMWREQGHPVPPLQGANPCKDTKCTGGGCGFLPPPNVSPILVPPPPPAIPVPSLSQCPWHPGTVRGGPLRGSPLDRGLVALRARGVLISSACPDAHGNGGEAAELLLEALPRPGGRGGPSVTARGGGRASGRRRGRPRALGTAPLTDGGQALLLQDPFVGVG